MTLNLSPTPAATAAMLTPAGRGAVAVIGVKGPVEKLDAAFRQLFQAANGKLLSEQPLGRICYGHWGGEVSEDIVIARVSETCVEVNCHGGVAAVDRILVDLTNAGFATVSWQEQMSDEQSAFEVECYETLLQATTSRTAVVLLEQQQGVLLVAIEQLARAVEQGSAAALAGVRALLQWAEFGVHLTEPWRVVISGRPNVGKSTLINALLGYSRSIVFDQPGTTRDVVTGETALDGWPIQLADTAGLRDSDDSIEREGIERARRAIDDSDCRCFVFDLSQPRTSEDEALLREVAGCPRGIIVGNKSDLPPIWTESLPPEAVMISAANGTLLDRLMARIVARLVPRVPEPQTPVPITRRQIACLEHCRDALVGDDFGAARQAIFELMTRAEA